jgi:hypothetical protein
MEEALSRLMLADAGISALVGTRVNWVVRPQSSALPAIVLNVIDTLPDYTMQGPSGLASSRVQVTCWSITYAAAKAVARAVEALLSGIDELVGDGDSPEAFTILRGGFQEGERESFEIGEGQTGLYSVSLDFIVWHGQG